MCVGVCAKTKKKLVEETKMANEMKIICFARAFGSVRERVKRANGIEKQHGKTN